MVQQMGDSRGVTATSMEQEEASTSGHDTQIYVGVQGQVRDLSVESINWGAPNLNSMLCQGLVGRMAFSDMLRPDAQQVVQQLRHLGLRVRLLSGDSAAAVAEMARRVCPTMAACSGVLI